MATKTQVTDGGSAVTGQLALRNQDSFNPNPVSAPTRSLAFGGGSIIVAIEDISTGGWFGPAPAPPAVPGDGLQFAIYISDTALLPGIVAHEFVTFDPAVDPTPWEIERAFSIAISGRRIWRTESHSPGAGRENSPVYAKEVTYTDEWVADPPIFVTVTFGSLSYSATQTWDGAQWIPAAMSPISGITVGFNQHKGKDWDKHMEVSGLAWDGGTVNFSRYEYESNAGHQPPGGTSGNYLDGLLGGIDHYSKDLGNWSRSVSHGQPYIVDFSDFFVGDREGQLLGDLRVSGGFTASNHTPSSLSWSTDP